MSDNLVRQIGLRRLTNAVQGVSAVWIMAIPFGPWEGVGKIDQHAIKQKMDYGCFKSPRNPTEAV
ncbi:MAG: hypothetical protein EA342_19030 [Leptolyngbya sp. LCM1.Bin17]|nr:MAG: hypothetical protein EA342_19030 [Leptolyngbya sp. LCM1.Bin17]